MALPQLRSKAALRGRQGRTRQRSNRPAWLTARLASRWPAHRPPPPAPPAGRGVRRPGTGPGDARPWRACGGPGTVPGTPGRGVRAAGPARSRGRRICHTPSAAPSAGQESAEELQLLAGRYRIYAHDSVQAQRGDRRRLHRDRCGWRDEPARGYCGHDPPSRVTEHSRASVAPAASCFLLAAPAELPEPAVCA